MGLYHKVYKVGDNYTSYSINDDMHLWNDFVSENGNPLFYSGSRNIYELENNTNLTLYGTLPRDVTTSDYLTIEQILAFRQVNKYIFSHSGRTLIYSDDYGKTWKTFNFGLSKLNVNGSEVNIISINYGDVICLNNSIGIISRIRTVTYDYYHSILYTDDFSSTKQGFTYAETNTLIPTAVNINNNAVTFVDILVDTDNISKPFVLLFDNFSNYTQRTNVQNVYLQGTTKLANDVIIVKPELNSSPYYIFKYESNGLVQYGPFNSTVSNTYSLGNKLYCNNYVYRLGYKVENNRGYYQLYKTSLENSNNETVLEFNLDTKVSEMFISNSYIYLGVGTGYLTIIDANSLEFFLSGKENNLDTPILDNITAINNDSINHFYIYLMYGYMETIKVDITPQDRTKIYSNDYSTITGSQVLENAVRSVNHKVYKITLKNNLDIGSSEYIIPTFTTNPQQYTGFKSGGFTRTEIWSISGHITIKTNLPIIEEITSENIIVNYNNNCYDASASPNHNDFINGHDAVDLYNTMDNIDVSYYTGSSPFPLVASDYANLIENDTTDITSISEFNSYSNTISNIQKIDNYTISFDYEIITKGIYWSSNRQMPPGLSVYFYYGTIKTYIAQNITFSIKSKSISSTSSDFIFSIDTNNGQYIQNNPLSRTENELFSLADTFFEDQADDIIQENKDGRMVLTVNSTSNLNLYLGKELQVELKDGTLANNGATFEVVGIKEKFTGINWKQTYTLKEKKSST